MKLLAFSACLFAAAQLALADGENEPQLSTRIDALIAEKLVAKSLEPTPIIDDAAFARRVTLDLAGRIPTVAELQSFLESEEADKRQRYVDQLLVSPDYAFHLRNELDRLLLAAVQRDNDWREYLLTATRDNRTWDRIFREIMQPDRERPDDKGPAAFLRARAKDLDTMTNDTSALLFGVNIACAKCHDHPLVDDWKQQHYFGLAAFFKRTYATKKGFLAEKFDGQLKFTTTEGDEEQAEFMFLTSTLVTEPERTGDDEAAKKLQQLVRDAERKEDAPPPPLPEFSPRHELVRLALEASESDFFA